MTRNRYIVAGALGLLVVLVVAGAGWAVVANNSDKGTASPADQIAGLQTFGGLTRNHVLGTVNYPQTPPVGGDHAPLPQNCGVYDRPIANENGVHSLEHGAVWITYRPDLSDADIATIDSVARNQPYVLVSPYPGLPAPVVASAWGLQVQLDGAADPRLAEFVQEFENGPQTPEPGAPCSGGVGHPK